MNYLEMIMKLFLNQGQQVFDPKEIGLQILSVIRNILKSLIILFIGSVIFCLLTGYLIDRLLSQLDQGVFIFTPSITLLLGLILIDAIILAYTLKEAIGQNDEEKKIKNEQVTSPVETAIAALILDYIKEREQNREQQIIHNQPSGNLSQE